jgi:opacity protein-like surface antigen
MNKVHASLLILLALIGLTSGRSFAGSLRNTDYISVEAGAFVYGDEVIDDAFGAHANLSGSINKMLNHNAVILVKLEGLYGEGESAGVDLTHGGLKGGVSLMYLLAPEKSADPYILAGGLIMYNEVESSDGDNTVSEDDSDAGFEIGGGVEFDLGPKSFGDLGLLYQNVGNFDALSPNVRFGCALNEKITGLFTAGYAIDEEDVWARLGLAVKL